MAACSGCRRRRLNRDVSDPGSTIVGPTGIRGFVDNVLKMAPNHFATTGDLRHMGISNEEYLT
jgi:hypothetical protein